MLECFQGFSEDWKEIILGIINTTNKLHETDRSKFKFRLRIGKRLDLFQDIRSIEEQPRTEVTRPLEFNVIINGSDFTRLISSICKIKLGYIQTDAYMVEGPWNTPALTTNVYGQLSMNV